MRDRPAARKRSRPIAVELAYPVKRLRGGAARPGSDIPVLSQVKGTVNPHKLRQFQGLHGLR
jgi:hypothetical protein